MFLSLYIEYFRDCSLDNYYIVFKRSNEFSCYSACLYFLRHLLLTSCVLDFLMIALFKNAEICPDFCSYNDIFCHKTLFMTSRAL